MASIRHGYQRAFLFYILIFILCSICGKSGHNSTHHKQKCSCCGEKGYNTKRCSKSSDDSPPAKLWCTTFGSVFSEYMVNHYKHVNQGEVDMIGRVAVRILDETPHISLNNATERVSFFTGFSYGYVRKIVSDIQTGTWPQKREKGLRRCKKTLYDREIVSAIHNSVEHMAKSGIFPTARRIRRKFSFFNGVNIKLGKLIKVLRTIGYEFRRNKSGENYIKETKEITDWRLKFTEQIKNYRESGYYPVYLDETYINENHVFSKGWFCHGVKVKVTTGKGSRWILFHAGGEQGWVPWNYKLFAAKKTVDYHDSMNGKHFNEIFEELSKSCMDNYGKCVFVADNASYHKQVSNPECRKTYWSKLKVKELKDLWSKGLVPNQSDVNEIPKTGKAIREIAFKQLPDPFLLIDDIASKYGHKVIFLPPYHPQLNPIETAWALVKNYVANNNNNHTFMGLKFLIESGINQVKCEQWEGLVRKSKNWENWYNFAGSVQLSELDKFRKENPSLVFSVGDTSSSEDSDTDRPQMQNNHDVDSDNDSDNDSDMDVISDGIGDDR